MSLVHLLLKVSTCDVRNGSRVTEDGRLRRNRVYVTKMEERPRDKTTQEGKKGDSGKKESEPS